MSTRKGRPQPRNTLRFDPRIVRFDDWFPPNRGFYAEFRRWLRESSYGDSALSIYSVAVRLALGLLDKPYWTIDPESDLQVARDYIVAQYTSAGTRQSYLKGVAKLAEYLRLRCHRPPPEKTLNWDYYTGSLPHWLAEAVRAELAHRRRNWPPERAHSIAMDQLGQLSAPLRWMAAHAPLIEVSNLTPGLWYAYADTRLANGIQPVTLNNELSALQRWLERLAEEGQPVCARFLRLPPLDTGPSLPRDVPPGQLRVLLAAVEKEAAAPHGGIRRMGLMDRAWVLLMLHSGLRTGEVRRLQLGEVDRERRRARIEQSKGLKDRLVPLSEMALNALDSYLSVRGPAGALPPQVFIFRHKMLSESYCGQRLQTYGERCGVRVTPHQLRHSCATLLLNAGAPVLTVQAILGHKHIDTTLGYARLYDGTVAADYFRAMAQVEQRLFLGDETTASPPHPGELLALVDSLRAGTLSPAQSETVATLRAGILALAGEAVAQGR